MDPKEKIKVQVQEAVGYISDKVKLKPEVGIILGSGQGSLAEKVAKEAVLSYDEIPHFPVPLTEGHAGNLVFGKLSGKNVAVMQGRVHYYEGYTMIGVTFPVRVIKALGAETLLITNAAGGLNPRFKVGDLMLISDHINLMGANPLIGLNDPELGLRFPDMSEAYSRFLRGLAKEIAQDKKIKLYEGVYAGVSGPNYETPAEAKFLAKIGASAVGMSTVPEVIVAVQEGLRVLGISCITNVLLAHKAEQISHSELVKRAEEATERVGEVIKGVLERL